MIALRNGTKIFKFATGFAAGDPHFTTDQTPPGTPEQRANGVYGGLLATYTVRDGRIYDARTGQDAGRVPSMTRTD